MTNPIKKVLSFFVIKTGLKTSVVSVCKNASSYEHYSPKTIGLVLFFFVATVASFVLSGFSIFNYDTVLADVDTIIETIDFNNNNTPCQSATLNSACIDSSNYYQNVAMEAKPENFLNLYLIEDKAFLLRTIAQEETTHLSEPLRQNQIITYTVKAGDNLGKIANSFGINVDTIKVANNLQKNILTPGQELTILPISGIFYQVKKGDTLGAIALKYKISSSIIKEYNNMSSDTLKIGEKIILPGAKEAIVAKSTSTASNTSTTGFKVDNSSASNSSYFIYPTTGWNWGEAHGIDGRAVDIANACGTPIYASASGIVIDVKTSGYNGGYGLYLKIQHDNGTSTLYAHLSSIAVVNGQYVNQGQTIGKMGTTGRSTGCHLHFEVIGARNPFIKR